MLDPAPAQDLPAVVIRQARWFTPNETEAAFFSASDPTNPPEEIARTLLTKGPQAVALKLGGRGVYLADRNGLNRQSMHLPFAR